MLRRYDELGLNEEQECSLPFVAPVLPLGHENCALLNPGELIANENARDEKSSRGKRNAVGDNHDQN
jgi:hypothetical protein